MKNFIQPGEVDRDGKHQERRTPSLLAGLPASTPPPSVQGAEVEVA